MQRQHARPAASGRHAPPAAMTFSGFCDRIDDLAVRNGHARPGQSHTDATGREHWRDYHDAGYTPAQAWRTHAQAWSAHAHVGSDDLDAL